MKVNLRFKKITGERKSLYLDFYPPILHPKTGEPTRRNFLGLYIYDKPKTVLEKKHNKETLLLGEQIRQKRDYELSRPEIYSAFEREQLLNIENGKRDFIEYFLKLTDERKGSNYDNWVSASKYLIKFTGGKLKFSELTWTLSEEFKYFLLNTSSSTRTGKKLGQNSVLSYFNKYKAALKQAYKDGYLLTDLNSKVATVKAKETKRDFLTIDEVNRLAKTECPIPILKQAALFAILSGLRFIDIQNLTWQQVMFIEGSGYFIDFTQQKTDGVEMHPISDQAFNLLGERQDHSEKVFKDLEYSAWQNIQLAKWIREAGILKEITFHNFRHTYSVLQLRMGTDIYTLSKMLGHKDLKTTQVYAKIVSATKIEAANKIKLDL